MPDALVPIIAPILQAALVGLVGFIGWEMRHYRMRNDRAHESLRVELHDNGNRLTRVETRVDHLDEDVKKLELQQRHKP